MTAIETTPGTTLDVDALADFLDRQTDMGQKWWPTYVRVVDKLPATGSGKIDKAPLRRCGWSTATDPVYVRVGRTAAYRLLDDDARAALVEEFAANGRTALLPVEER